MKDKAKILLVEDDQNLGFVIKDNLEISGYDVLLCDNGEKAWDMFVQSEFNICVLDIMLPKQDGFSLAQNIRKHNQQIPIIFLSAKSMKEDKIMGFKIGADDYMTKPFSIEELVLRIEVFLKRAGNSNKPIDSSEFVFGSTTFNYKNLSLNHKGETITLTQKEADILRHFCLNQGEVVRREDILKNVWGDDDYFIGRSLDVFISKLRNYLKEDESIEIINIHGVGFKLKVNQS